MKRLIVHPYLLLRWLIIIFVALFLFLIFLIESPSVVLSFAKSQLKKQGVSYGSISGGFLSGIRLTDVNYQEQVKIKRVNIKIDWEKLSDRVLYIDDIKVEGIEVDKEYLASLIDSNSSKKNSSSDSNLSLPFDRMVLNRADISLKDIVYANYRIDSAKLKIRDFFTDMKTNHSGNVELDIDSNVTKLKLSGSIEDDFVKLVANIEANRNFINPFVADNNLTLTKNPLLTLKADGNMTSINYHLNIHKLGLEQNKYKIDSKKLILFGNYNIHKKDVVATLSTELKGSMAYLKLDGKTKLNLDDLNSSLNFNISSTITPQKSFVASQIADSNISLKKIEDIDIFANGTLKETKFRVDFKGLRAKKDDIEVKIKKVFLSGKTAPLKGDTTLKLYTDFSSTAGNGQIEDSISLNFNKPKSSFRQSAIIDINGSASYINSLLKDKSIVVEGVPKVRTELDGGMQKIMLKLDGNIDFRKDNNPSKVLIESRPIEIDLKNSIVNGGLRIQNSSKRIGFNLDSSFFGDYSMPKKLNINSSIDIKNFNSFGINLNPIAPLNLKLKNTPLGLLVKLDSKKMKLLVKSSDYDRFSFGINTEKLYLYKIVELPKELKHKFIKLNLNGTATISKEYFTLKGAVESNKKFRAKIDIKNSNHGVDGNIKTAHLLATLKGNLKKKKLDADIKIDSLKELQTEINKLYKIEKFDIDGSLNASAKLNGKEIFAKIDSPKVKLGGLNIKSINLDAEYKKELLTINKLQFETTGFKDKKMNSKFYLNKKGKIYLGKRRDIFLDIYPNILIEGKGTKNRLDAKITIDSLPLGHPDYGSMFLNCDIDYRQHGQKKSIVGSIDIDKMKLFYEAKFLDSDYDSDVVIITKKDKNREKKEDDLFLKYTAIDLKIKAKYAKYKTKDIALGFNVDLKADKKFGKDLKLLGRVKEIIGHVDQVPKRYKVKESNIIFTGGKKINPLLDISVEYKLPQVLIKIGIGGTANRPKLNFTSEPPLPKKDILSYLLLGVSTANLGKDQGALSKEAELFILNQAAQDLAYDIELDRLFIKDDGTGEGYAIETGKKISEKNMFIIESTKEGNSFILEHDVSKHIKLRVGQHQKELPSQSIDLYFRKKFR